MRNDHQDHTSSWSDALQELNVPKLLLGPAGEALSRLIGSVADVPGEYVKSFTQGIQDKREARTEVSRALAKAVAAQVSADKDLMQRATQSLLAKELRAQSNKEGVARKTIEHLAEDSGVPDDNPATPDDDWLNVFEKYAENASSEKLRDLWGRVLAKEIRKPKSFSLRTMRFVSELDAETAQLFEKVASQFINNEFMLKSAHLEGQPFVELLRLQDAGLLTGVNGDIHQIIRGSEPRVLGFRFSKSIVLVHCDGAFDIRLSAIRITDIGKDLLKIVHPFDDPAMVQAFVETIPKSGGVAKIQHGKINDEGTDIVDRVTAWEKPAEEETGNS